MGPEEATKMVRVCCGHGLAVLGLFILEERGLQGGLRAALKGLQAG